MPLVDNLSSAHGVGPVCRELDIAPSTYYRHQLHRHNPERRSARDKRDAELKQDIQRVFDENHGVYGYRKVWHKLIRGGIRVARCRVARLMKAMQIRGACGGKA